ncbi:putative killer cell immunoglobulin-like receptor like protein KIR3DP1 [Peromyscus californicus insignis]|uniref:putative killer cell immunoglobulin-like receptor like protein KIR3DP1 n=1 Tax=Peromyscus californicus insignis TaxID=564181 RepID=UPI0022A79B39|nr:putative killer cell immunoglobulin-like receptor like protein KIR3DP1 [Peromyscus californicus insignis]
MCKSPVGFSRFRLEKENLRIIDVINSSSSKTEARFYLGKVRKDTVGHYRCLYEVKNTWSPRSETLVLEVIHEDITQASATITEVTPGSTLQSYKVWNGVRMALAGVILLVLGAIIGEAWYDFRGLQTCKRQEEWKSGIVRIWINYHESFFAGFVWIQGISAQVVESQKPFLSAWPSPIVPIREHVTLYCQSELGFEMFSLFKEQRGRILQMQNFSSQQSFVIGPVTTAHAGIYRCQGFYSESPHGSSALSDSLEIVVTGIYRKPSLLALPAPLVKSGGAVTLKCFSEIVFETFILVLHRKGLSVDPLYLVGEPYDGGYQANISIAPVTAAHAGTYRCYGSVSHQPYEWSDPSDSLDITIKGPVFQNCTLGNSIRIVVAGLVLLALLLMLTKAWWSHEELKMERRKILQNPTAVNR